MLEPAGYFVIEESAVSLVKAKGRTPSIPSIQKGDVIFCNHVSLIEILYLLSKYSPLFVTVPNQFEESESETKVKEKEFEKFGGIGNVGEGLEGKVLPLSWFRMLSSTLCNSKLELKQVEKQMAPLDSVLEKARASQVRSYT